MKKMVIFGAGSLAHLAYIHFLNVGENEIAAFTVHEEYLKERKIFGLDVVAYEEIERKYPPDDFSMFIAIGYRKVNKFRADIYHESKSKGYELNSCISMKGIETHNIDVGDNCLIMPNTIIQPFAQIGDNVIIWSGSYVGYQSSIGNHSYIAAAAVIAGNVKVGPYCFVGVNATIKDGIIIAPECVIGAGAVFLKDTESETVYRAPNAEKLSYKSSEIRYFK